MKLFAPFIFWKISSLLEPWVVFLRSTGLMDFSKIKYVCVSLNRKKTFRNEMKTMGLLSCKWDLTFGKLFQVENSNIYPANFLLRKMRSYKKHVVGTKILQGQTHTPHVHMSDRFIAYRRNSI